MSFHVYGIGTASPPHAISQEHAVALAREYGCETAEQQRQLKALYRLTRVRTRRSVVLESDSRDGVPRQTFFPAMQDASDHGPTTAERMARYNATRRRWPPRPPGRRWPMRGSTRRR